MNIEARRTAVGSAVQGTAVVVLAAISICHMLNDVIQSLIMAIYPMLKERARLDFGQIGLITFTFQFTASVLQPVVGYVHRPLPDALFARARHELVADRASPHRLCHELLRGACRRRADRHGLFGVPSRILARRPACLGWTPRHGAIGVSGRRQFRHGARAAARGLHRAALRAAAASPGSPSRRWSPSCCCQASASGTARPSS